MKEFIIAMTDANQQQVPSGESPSESSGELESKQGEHNESSSESDKVDYKSYLKVLNEKKKRDEELTSVRTRLAELESANKQAEETRLKEQEKFKELAEMKSQEVEKLQQEIQLKQQQELNARKLDSFLKALDGTVERKYWDHIDIDQIQLSESGDVDEMSVSNLVNTFRQTYPEVIRTKQKEHLPNQYPSGSGSLTYEQWKQLPAKEMRARLHEVMKK